MSGFAESITIPGIKPETLEKIEQVMPQYLFYAPHGKKKREYQCTCCHAKGIAEIPGKGGQKTECPNCHEEVTLKSSNRMTYGAPSTKSYVPVICFKNVAGTLMAVGAKVTRTFYRNSYDGLNWYPDLEIEEYEVYSFRPGHCDEWKKGCGWVDNQWEYGWVLQKRPREPFTAGNIFGMGNGPEDYYIFQTEEIWESDMKYCAVDLYMNRPVEDGSNIYGLMRYLTAYCEKPKLELVVKWGLMDVAEDWVRKQKTNGHTVNWKKNTPWEFLKISKSEWNIYRTSTWLSVEALRYKKRLRLSVAELHEICFENREQAEKWGPKAVELGKRGVSLKRQIKYAMGQKSNIGYPRSLSGILGFWIDYLEMAEKLGRDVSLNGAIMPRNLVEAHDEMVALTRIMRDELKKKELQERQKEYQIRWEKLEKKYGYRSGELMIKAPESAQEIIEEGNTLHICVGGYAERHLTGKTTILFLRRARKPDTPYICIELDKEDRIVQIHGYKNEHCGTAGKRPRDPRIKFEAFLNEWLAWVKAGSKRTEKQTREDMTA